MNRLIQELPDTVMIDDVLYPINTSSKNVLLTMEAFGAAQHGELLSGEVWEIFYENMFQEPYPPDPLKAFAVFEKFLNRCNDPKDNQPQVIDFINDNEMIYDALLSIGLSNQEIRSMHWWDLVSRLSEVENTRFNRVVHLRMKNKGIGGKLTKEEREECARIGWDIINMVTPEQKEQAKENAEPFEQYLDGK